ncbi:MAG: hypothetical protein JW776_05555 [Candidatus Lokiarchaeota archaeon]|nr:hypothetical protein [Candidatus Lokiarchaeota archaeon]
MKPLVFTVILSPTKGINTEELFRPLSSAIHHNITFNYLFDIYRIPVDRPNKKKILLNIWKINICSHDRPLNKKISLEIFLRTNHISWAILIFDMADPDSYKELIAEREHLEVTGGITNFSIIGIHSDNAVESTRHNLENHLMIFDDVCYEIDGNYENVIKQCIQELAITMNKD